MSENISKNTVLTPQEPTATAAAKPKKLRRVLAQQIQVGDNLTWKVTVPVEWEIADILSQEAWVNVSPRLNRRDFIDVVPDDLRWYARLMVLNTEKTGTTTLARVKLLESHEFEAKDFEIQALDSDYAVKWKGETAQHGVYRKSTSSWVKEGFATKELAFQWLAGYIKAQAN